MKNQGFVDALQWFRPIILGIYKKILMFFLNQCINQDDIYLINWH